MSDPIAEAAALLRAAGALVFTAGAGMGVDSGLPDFRGPEGFWRAYPPFRALRLRFEEVADPRWFHEDPALAWGFYGHRLELYRRTAPHEGYAILRRWAAGAPGGAFVFTSNVDGHFARSGFAQGLILECHGSLDWLQCLHGCGAPLFSSRGVRVDVDARTFRARPPLPACPGCGDLARPNVLMFGDGDWDTTRAREQQTRLGEWMHDRRQNGQGVVVVECGAGTAVPSVRIFGERLVAGGARLVRINPREPEVPGGGVGIPLGARDALTRIDEARNGW